MCGRTALTGYSGPGPVSYQNNVSVVWPAGLLDTPGFTIIRSSLMRKIQENSADRIFPESFFVLYKNRVDHLEIQRIDEGINSTRNFSISLLQIHPLIGRALSSGLLLVNLCLVSCVANSSITCVHCTVSSVICCF